jgi:hypothetical protein
MEHSSNAHRTCVAVLAGFVGQYAMTMKLWRCTILSLVADSG